MPTRFPLDLARLFDRRTLERALDYVPRVRGLHAERQALLAEVDGTASRPYRVTIAGPVLGRRSAWIDCTCPVGSHCKHAAAVLIRLAVYGTPDGEDAGLEPLLPDWLQAETPTAPASQLPADWRRWLAAARRDIEQATPPVEHELPFYALDLGGERPELQVGLRSALKSGVLGKFKPRRWNELAVRAHRLPIDTDERLLLRLLGAGAVYGFGAPLAGDQGEQALHWALATGRLYFLGDGERALSLGEPRALDIGWTLAVDGSQRFRIRDADGLDLFALERLWCLDRNTAELAPVEGELEPATAARLLRAPPVPAEHTIEIGQALSGLPGMGSRIPLPQGLPDEVERVAPRFVVRLTMRGMPDPEAPRHLAGLRVERPAMELYAEYRGQRVALDTGRARLHALNEGRLTAIERDAAAEQALLDAIATEFEPAADQPSHVRPLCREPGGYLAPIAAGVERLRELLEAFDARIEFDPSFPFELLETAETIELEVEDGVDWFSTSLGIELDGERIDLLPFLISAVDQLAARGGHLPEGDFPLYLRLDERRLVSVPGERLRPLLQLLLQWSAPRERIGDDGRLRLQRFEAASLADAGRDADGWRISGATRELAERLAGFRGIPEVAPPEGLQAELRDYQLHGLAWLQFLREFGFGGVLADDMGLGKTVQLLAHLLVEQAAGRTDRPSLVVAPTSVVFNWRSEAARFAPGLRVLLLHGPQRASDFERIAEHDLVLTSYALLPRDEAVLLAQPWHVVALDEAQAIKNAKARASQLVRRFEARQRLCLTGTPVENHLGELWAQFDFLMPGLLGSDRQFRRVFRNPIEKHGDHARQIELNRRVAPFLLRRTKDNVVRELPPKTETVQAIELTGPQRDLYETLRIAMQSRLQEALQQRGFAQSRIEILDALLKLRQACCDPRLVKLPGASKARHSAKLDALLEMLDELLAEGRRVLVFSQFTSMLDLIEIELRKQGRHWLRLSGESTNRGALVERFQRGEVPLFLLSLKAGGVGLNLTAADTVIHYDPWWNPAAEDQATDRAYRIGQDKPVFVYKLIAQGTVEEKMLAMQAKKRALAGALYDDGGASQAQFDAEDLAALLAPIE